MKRFWKETKADTTEGGWTVLLDGRPVRTPAKRAMVVPVQTMAEEIAAEWDAQAEEVDPRAMPMTRVAATCLDRVAPEQAAVAEMIAAYGETDLLYYRAETPAELAERQAIGWDPVLDWASERFGGRLVTGAGVMHIAQPAPVLAALSQAVSCEEPWSLTGLAELTTLSGSLILGLAVRHGWLGADEAWALSRIDEEWNIEQWGEDEEAAAQAALKRADFMMAARVTAMTVGEA